MPEALEFNPENIDKSELISVRSIRSDLHCHSVEGSPVDAVYTVTELARFYHDVLGVEFLGITNHYYGEDRLSAVQGGIDQAHELYPDLAFLNGLELDINLDGTIDIPENIEKSQLNIGSIHGKPNTDISDRILTALNNPYIDIVGHPGRYTKDLFGIDWDGICAEAATLDKALEINISELLNPDIEGASVERSADRVYLMKDEILCNLAKHKTKISIGTDLHQDQRVAGADTLGMEWRKMIEVLEKLQSYGITKDQVVNTLNYDELINWVNSHRKH